MSDMSDSASANPSGTISLPDAAPTTPPDQGTSPYKYTPLNSSGEIRLLVLQLGEDLETLRCEIVPTSLSDGIEYIALSYTWDDQNALTESEDRPETEKIIVDDEFTLEIKVS